MLRNFIIALSFPIFGIGVIFLHLNLIASSEANPKSLTIDDLKQMLAMDKQIATEQHEQARAEIRVAKCVIEHQRAFKKFQINEQKWLEAANEGKYIYYLPSKEFMDWRECISQLSNAK